MRTCRNPPKGPGPISTFSPTTNKAGRVLESQSPEGSWSDFHTIDAVWQEIVNTLSQYPEG